MGKFLMTGCTIRWNPTDDVGTRVSPDEGVVFGGILQLLRFSPGDVRVEGCTFIKDESLPKGRMVVEP